MKDHPIIFSGEMVRAILAGRKTQTRRVVKGEVVEGGAAQGCPFGPPGSRLWVRENHIPKASGIIYRADFDPVEAAGIGGMYGGWKSPIFMPRAASRITLEIKSVRIERLNDISEAGAKSEGVTPDWPAVPRDGIGSRIDGYANLWETIHGKGSWSNNPWVWVIEFEIL